MIYIIIQIISILVYLTLPSLILDASPCFSSSSDHFTTTLSPNLDQSVLYSYLCAVESHTGEHGLGDTSSLQLVSDLLVDFTGDLGGRGVAPGMVADAFGRTPRDGRVVEELLVDGLRVLMGQQAANG